MSRQRLCHIRSLCSWAAATRYLESGSVIKALKFTKIKDGKFCKAGKDGHISPYAKSSTAAAFFLCQTAKGVFSDPVRSRNLFILIYSFYFFQGFIVALSRRSVLTNGGMYGGDSFKAKRYKTQKSSKKKSEN